MTTAGTLEIVVVLKFPRDDGKNTICSIIQYQNKLFSFHVVSDNFGSSDCGYLVGVRFQPNPNTLVSNQE